MKTHINLSQFWRRIQASIIDSLLFFAFNYFIFIKWELLIFSSTLQQIFNICLPILYFTILNSKLCNGQTIGKHAVGIQVVDINGNTLSMSKSLLRTLIYAMVYVPINVCGSFFLLLNFVSSMLISFLPLAIVLVYIFNKNTRQSLHDIAVGSYVATLYRNETSAIMPIIDRKKMQQLSVICFILFICSLIPFIYFLI